MTKSLCTLVSMGQHLKLERENLVVVVAAAAAVDVPVVVAQLVAAE